ncbi:hypothetical protein TNCV_121251 [Trichonephila clavipes]|nr:hypothetical protein TNCV_121251 [Trichonephila clavipes]
MGLQFLFMDDNAPCHRTVAAKQLLESEDIELNVNKDTQSPDKALLMKLFYMNEESATITLRKFRVQKNVMSGKVPLTPAGFLKLVKRFEETGVKSRRIEHEPDDHA